MTLFFGILTFVVVLAVLILVHELGHFGTAKLFGVRVEEFGLGFPPRLKTWWRNGTIYSLNAVPLGGFVRMAGENGESNDPASFGAKPPWQRLLILLAGPTMNLLFAVTIFFVTFMVGFPDGTTDITGVAPHSPAVRAGLQAGDRILSVNGQQVSYRSDLSTVVTTEVRDHPGTPVTIQFERAATVRTTTLVPRVHPPANQGAMGIVLAQDATRSYGPVAAAGKAVDGVVTLVVSLPALLASVPSHGTSDIAGPIGIAHLTTQTVSQAPREGPSPILYLVALLSSSLGVLNLLPIPALDGGRIVFVLISWIRRRNLDPEVEGIVHLVGMALLLLLIVFISYQDLARWITGSS